MSPTASPCHGASWRFLIVVLLVALVLLLPAGPARASGPYGTVHGVIRNSTSGSVIAGADVQVSASDFPWSFETTTSAGGSYAVSVPNHVYAVVVTADAYDGNATSVAIGSGQSVWVNMSLTPAAARTALLQGYVKDGVSSAAVTQGVVAANAPSGVTGATYQNASSLDGTGYYAMRLVPGTYTMTTEGIQNYTPYSYSYVTLTSSQVRWFNISLTSHPDVAWINGTVLDAGNSSRIVGATITASIGSLDLVPTTSNGTGRFSLLAPTGSVLVAVDALGYAPDSTSVYVWGAGTTTITVYLTPLSAHIRGFVRDGLTGAPVVGAQLVASPFWSTGYWDQAVTNNTGAYGLTLTADDFDLYVTATGYTSTYTWAFLSTGENVWWNVTLWPIVSTLRGYLIDGGNGSHVAGLTVYVYDARSGYSASAVSDASGSFSFALPPSPALTLRVYGTAPFAGAIAYPATRPYVTTWANLTLARLTATLVANVTNALTGSPISGAQIAASWSYGAEYGVTNASGAAAVAVPSGLALTVSAWAAGYLSAYLSVPTSGGTYAVTLELFPNLAANVTVKGYVHDAVTNASLVSVLVQASGYGPSAPYDYTDGTGFYQLSLVTYPQNITATDTGYAAAIASVNPAPGSTIWLNLSLVHDTTLPSILSFTAIPAANLGPSNPAALTADVNETDLSRAQISILQLRSTAAGVGTFVRLGQLDASTVSLSPTTRGNFSVTSSWDTRTPVGRLSDGLNSEWWPASASYAPYQVLVSGYWSNASLASPAYGTAVFDSRTGALLYVYTYSYGYIAPQDQPTSTFTPYTTGVQVDLTSAAIVGYSLVTGRTYRVGSLTLQVVNPAPGGTYAALLETYDSAGNYAAAAALMTVVADTTPPTANAGHDQTVDQGTVVSFDGTASSDNVGVVNYTWSFYDGSWRALYGPTPTYRFLRAGAFTVTLTVQDAAGNSATATVRITVLDVTPPTVAITTPTQGANVSGSVSLLATASDNVGVARVEFFVDGVQVGNVSAGPYTSMLDTRSLANGAHTITAVAYDAAGNSATATCQITVYNAPSGGALPFGLDVPVFGALIALIAAGVVILLLLARRRRKDAPAGGTPPQPADSQAPPRGP